MSGVLTLDFVSIRDRVDHDEAVEFWSDAGKAIASALAGHGADEPTIMGRWAYGSDEVYLLIEEDETAPDWYPKLTYGIVDGILTGIGQFFAVAAQGEYYTMEADILVRSDIEHGLVQIGYAFWTSYDSIKIPS